MSQKANLPKHCRRKKGGQIEVRINVPQDVVEAIGKTALVRSLGNVSLSEANDLAPEVVAEFKSIIRNARALHQPMRIVTRADFLKRLADWRRTIFSDLINAYDDPNPTLPDYGSHISEKTVFERQHLDSEEVIFPRTRREASETLIRQALGIETDFEIPDHQEAELHRTIAQIVDDYSRLTYDIFKGVEGAYEDAMLNATSAALTAGSSDGSKSKTSGYAKSNVGIRLSEAFERWRTKHELKGKSHKTANDFEVHVQRFIEVNGNLDIGKITRPMIEEYAALMLTYPSRPSAKVRKLSVRDAIEYAETNDLKRLSPRTVKSKSLGAISAVLGNYVEDGALERNPVKFDIIETDYEPELKRLPFDETELRELFSNAIFKGAKPTAGGKGPAAAWLPIISLLTGARLEEIAQLELHDFELTEGKERFEVSTFDGEFLTDRRLKNQSSKRVVPISKKLKEIGLIDYIRSIEAKGGYRLFEGVGPVERHESDAQRSAAWSKYFARFLDNKIGITDPKKVFHSLRHNFIREARRLGIPRPIESALTGHSTNSRRRTSADGYGRDADGSYYDLEVLQENINLVRFDKALSGIKMPIKASFSE